MDIFSLGELYASYPEHELPRTFNRNTKRYYDEFRKNHSDQLILLIGFAQRVGFHHTDCGLYPAAWDFEKIFMAKPKYLALGVGSMASFYSPNTNPPCLFEELPMSSQQMLKLVWSFPRSNHLKDYSTINNIDTFFKEVLIPWANLDDI